MGMASMGLARAEAENAIAVQSGDKILIQRLGSTPTNAYYQPLEITSDELATFVGGGTLRIRALGTATFNGSGSIAVTMASITAAALVFATEHGTGAAAVSATVTASTGFTLTSSNSSDASVVNYIVYDV